MNTLLPSLLGAALLASLPLSQAPLEPISAPALTHAGTGAPQADAAQPFAGGLLPPVTAGFEVPADRDISLADLVDSLSAVSGLRFVVSSQTRQLLNDTPCGLLSGGTIEASEVYPFVESVLKHHDIVLQRLSGHKLPVAALFGLNNGRASTGLGWSPVAVENIDSVRDHRALLVQCVLDLAPVDVRMLTNAGRSMIRDQNYQGMIALTETTIALRGTGSEVAAMVDTFKFAAEAESQRHAANKATQALHQAEMDARQRAARTEQEQGGR